MHGVCVLCTNQEQEKVVARGKKGEGTAQIPNPAHLPSGLGMWGTPSLWETNELGMIQEWRAGDVTCFEKPVIAVKSPCPCLGGAKQRSHCSSSTFTSSLAFPELKAALCPHGKRYLYQRNPNKLSDDPSRSLALHSLNHPCHPPPPVFQYSRDILLKSAVLAFFCWSRTT